MFADASSFAATRRLSAEGPSAEGRGPKKAQSRCTAALGPRRLALWNQRTGLSTRRRALVGL